MKRHLFLLCLLCLGLGAGAQNPIFLKIKEILIAEHPEIALNDKLIAFNSWSLEDVEGRERNKSFDNVYDIYEWAKLKGGKKGLVVVSIHQDGSTPTASTTLYHDGIRKLILISGQSLKEVLRGAPSNMVFDSEGNEVYRNLQTDEVRGSVNKLITR